MKKTILTELKDNILKLLNDAIAADGGKPAKAAAKEAEAEDETPATASDDDDDEDKSGEEADSASVEFPSLAEIGKMGKADLAKTCAGLNITTDDMKIADMKAMLVAVHNITHEEEVDPTDAARLCKAIGMPPKKKHEENMKQLGEYFTTEAEDDTADETPAAASDDDDDEEETPAPKAKKGAKAKAASDDDDDDDDETPAAAAADEDDDDETPKPDGVDRESLAKSFDAFPAKADMLEQLNAYNEAAEAADVEPIEIIEGKTKGAYRKLVAELIGADEEIYAWGTPYIRDGQAYSCGLPLTDHTVKGYEQAGKCVVTGKIFAIDDEGDFVEVQVKAKK